MATEWWGLVAEFLGARRLVAGIGNNVNQLARVANATGEVPAELLVVVAAAKRMIARLDEAVAELRSS